MNVNLTQLIALIGCITGISSLLINFYNVLNNREKLKIKFHKKTNYFFDKLELYKQCKTNNQAIICLDIISKSPMPTTVYKLIIKEQLFDKKKLNWYVFEKDKFSLIETYKSEREYSRLEFDMKSKFDTPLKISGYEVFSGSIFIPFFPDCKEDTKHLWLIFKTARSTRIRKVHLEHFKTKYYNPQTNQYDDTD